MAAIDPYAACPCGSGEKFKWCCHKVEAFAQKAHRLFEGGQIEAALSALDEGLAKAPGNPWLTLRRAIYLIRQRKTSLALPILRDLIAAHPSHSGAQSLLIQVLISQEGPGAAVAQLQDALRHCPVKQSRGLTLATQMLGMFLAEIGDTPAARKHLELSQRLLADERPDSPARISLNKLESNPGLSPWLRHPYQLTPIPDGLTGPAREQFQEALELAEKGLWSSAAAIFQSLAFDRLAEAERNLGLCRLWLLDNDAARDALRRYVALVGPSEDAVDIESLCQILEAVPESDQVEHVHLVWTLRDHDRLLGLLRNSDRADFEETGPLDPDDPDSFEVETFTLLDRPKPADGLLPEHFTMLPRVIGRVHVGQETVILETFDDGRMEGLTAWLTELAGSTIPPAQPRTKTLHALPRQELALRSELWMPESPPRELAESLLRQEQVRIIQEIWPETSMNYLAGQTPRQAGESGHHQVALRAAVARYESNYELIAVGVDFDALRARLRISAEPEIDPTTVDIESVHLGRLHRIPAKELDDDRLVALYVRAHRTSEPLAIERAAQALMERPRLLDQLVGARVTVFGDLATLAMGRGDRTSAFALIARGRETDPSARGVNAIRWDFLDLKLRARVEEPDVWVPQLAILLDRYSSRAEDSTILLTNLVEMGLVEVSPHPDDPGEMLLDHRALQMLLAEYGPRITTASGGLGVSASRGGIWTPGVESGGGDTTQGGIWTPGSASTSQEKPKIIIPGR